MAALVEVAELVVLDWQQAPHLQEMLVVGQQQHQAYQEFPLRMEQVVDTVQVGVVKVH
jgi:hypothetical protein